MTLRSSFSSKASTRAFASARAATVGWVRRLWSSARGSKVTATAFAIGMIASARIALLQLRCLPLPIVVEESHHWRQSFTYGVAWNFAHARAIPDFFHPRMYLESAESNVVAMEAPIYPYLCGLVMRVVGEGTFSFRLVSWLSLVATAAILFVWLGQQRARTSEVWSDRAGLLVALGVSTSAAVDFRSVQPDPLAAGLALGAAFVFSRYAERGRRRDLALAATLTGLAVLTKPVALGVVPGLVVFGAWRRDKTLRNAVNVVTAVGVSLVPYVLWDRWATHLSRSLGLTLISIEHRPAEILANLKSAGYVREAVLHLLPSYAGSWWLVPAIVAGTYRALADPKLRRLGVPFLVWLAGYLTELVAFGNRLQSNYYYFVLGPAPVAFFGALGLGAVVEVLGATSSRPSLVMSRTAAIGALTAAGVLFARSTNWSSVDADALGFVKNARVWTDDLGLAFLLVSSLVAFAIAPAVHVRAVPTWLRVPLVLAFLATGYPASQTTWQFLRFYSAVGKRPSERDLPELRAAVDRYSSLDERIAVSLDEPIWFHYARRNGFALTGPNGQPLERVRARGARLYLQLNTTPSPPPGRLLGKGPWWELYCIAADDCPSR